MFQPVVRINTANPPIFTCYCDVNGHCKATSMTWWCETPLCSKKEQHPPAEPYLIGIQNAVCRNVRQSQTDELFNAFKECSFQFLLALAYFTVSVNRSLVN